MVPVIKKSASDCTTKATIEANTHWAIMTVAKKPVGPRVGSLTVATRIAGSPQPRSGTQSLANSWKAACSTGRRGTQDDACPQDAACVGCYPPGLLNTNRKVEVELHPLAAFLPRLAAWRAHGSA